MANYYGVTRTNYFRVTDEEAYEKLFDGLTSEDIVQDFTYKDENGTIFHGFGAYGVISWVDRNSADCDYEYDFDHFLTELQKILPEDDAFILMESGYEKLRYVTGFVIVVTKEGGTCGASLDELALEKARDMLGNPNFKTRMEF